jgi:hypothetical protein
MTTIQLEKQLRQLFAQAGSLVLRQSRAVQLRRVREVDFLFLQISPMSGKR